MVEEKNWYESRTILGALVAVLASVIGGFGFNIDEGMQSDFTESIVQLVGALGAMIAIYRRLNATRVIS